MTPEEYLYKYFVETPLGWVAICIFTPIIVFVCGWISWLFGVLMLVGIIGAAACCIFWYDEVGKYKIAAAREPEDSPSPRRRS